jgi:hypothetical protein
MTNRALSARALAIALLLGAVGVPSAHSGFPPQSRPADGKFERGELVRIKDVKKPGALKIVGLPDEIVEANDSGVYIDDVAVTGYSREFTTRHRLSRQYIPMDHYFVMGEERVSQDISEHLGIHPAETIERAQ